MQNGRFEGTIPNRELNNKTFFVYIGVWCIFKHVEEKKIAENLIVLENNCDLINFSSERSNFVALNFQIQFQMQTAKNLRIYSKWIKLPLNLFLNIK